MAHPLNLHGRVALITGGAGGMGRCIAARLLARGARVILADVSARSLAQAVADLGPGVEPVEADLTQRAALEALVAHVQQQHGRLDVLVNNAAVTVTTSFEQRSPDSIVDELNINLVSPILTTRLLLPLLQRAGDGRVISIVSLGGLFPLPETSLYSASKFGLRGAMLCLGLDGPRLGVRFGIVNPSATETPMLIREAIEGGNTLQFMDPPQRPEDVAEQVMRTLDQPCLERYVRPSESWLARLAMLWPNGLPRLTPLFARSGEKGHRRYLQSLAERGLIVQRDGAWQMAEPAAPSAAKEAGARGARR